MNNNENAEYNNTLHFHVYNILCLHIIDNLTKFFKFFSKKLLTKYSVMHIIIHVADTAADKKRQMRK